MHELHLVPSVLGQLLHIVADLQLTVECQQRVIEVGDGRDDVTLHHRLIVLGGDELHLGTALHREQIAEEVYVPRGRDGQRVRLGGGGTIKRLERPLRAQGDRGQVVSDMVSGDRCHILEQFVELLKIWHQWGCYGNDVFILHNMFGVYRLPFRA